MNEHVKMNDDEKMINQKSLFNVWVDRASNDSSVLLNSHFMNLCSC